MQTVLIVSKDKEKAIIQAKNICKKEGVDPLDTELINLEKALGIEDVRNFQKKLFFKPLKSKTKTLILDIKDAPTDEAQNALLKVLEEPPNNTIIMLIVSSSEILLPTVLSRCNIINLKQVGKPQSDDTQYSNILISLSTYGTGDKLKLAQDNGKTREDAKIFLESLILTTRKTILNKVDPKLLIILRSLTKAHKVISTTNVNQRLVLENLFLPL